MTAALLTKLIAAGTPADLVAEVAMELGRAAAVREEAEALREADEARKARLRDGNAERQRNWRDRHNALSRVTGVTERDVTLVTPDGSLDKKAPPDPLKELNSPAPTVEAEASPVPPVGVDTGPKPKVRRKGKRRPGSRLGADWQPPAVTELPLEIQAIVGRWPAGAYEVTALQFRNHWFAEGRAIGAKRDWPRTWCNWVIREAAAVKRAERAGVDFAEAARAAAPGTGGEVNAQRLAETAAAFRRIGRIEDAEEYERLAEAAGHRALDSS